MGASSTGRTCQRRPNNPATIRRCSSKEVSSTPGAHRCPRPARIRKCTTTVTNRDHGFDTFAQGVITSWATHDFGLEQLVAGIKALYTARLEFPAAWPQHRRDAFLNTHADAAATQLATLLDDLTDTAVERYGRENYCLPDAATLTELVKAARSDVLDGVELIATYALPDEIASAAAADPVRGAASMTACGPGQRPTTSARRLQPRHSRDRRERHHRS